MKFRFSAVFIAILVCFQVTLAQNKIIKVDFENGSFKNFPKLPFNDAFILEGEVSKDVSLVQVEVAYSNGKKPLNTYYWNRSDQNNSESFEMIISNSLKSDTKYDFNITTFGSITPEKKIDLEESLRKRIIYYLKNQTVIKGKKISIESPRQLYSGLNSLISEALTYHRSKNGIEFKEISKLVETEICKLRGEKLLRLRRADRSQQDSIHNAQLQDKLDYISTIVIAEIQPFISSELVYQTKVLRISGVETEKDRFTLPINAGMYVWNVNGSNSSISTTSITPGFGITFPFSRSLKIKDRNITSLGLSVGVLSEAISNANNEKLVTPGVNLPVYTAVGIKMFNLIRLNAGTLIVNQKGTGSVNKLQFIPTLGVSLELNLWLGVNK
jgi:hypothetical protein